VIGLENLSKPVINRKRLQRVGTEAVSAPIISIIGLCPTAPRFDDVSIKLVVHYRSSTLVGHSFRKRVRNGERRSVPPHF